MANKEKEEAIRLYRAGMAAADLEQLEEALRNFRSEPEVPVIGDRSADCSHCSPTILGVYVHSTPLSKF